MRIISGKETAAHITEQVKNEVEALKAAGRRLPKLAVIRVGEKADDISYERGAVKRMDMAGIEHEEFRYPENISKEKFCSEFEKINSDINIDGILVLRPLPAHLEEERLITVISPEKDIDCISPVSLGRLINGEKNCFAPCTAAAVVEILKFAGIDIKGKRATIIGRSNVVGRPLALLLISGDATVTICHTVTADLEAASKNAEILVVSCGKAKLINENHVSEGAVVIDVGINLDENGKLCGDVDMDAIKEKAAVCTPVPGGVGAVTTSVLAKQVLLARLRKGDS